MMKKEMTVLPLKAFLMEQLEGWDLARGNYDALSRVLRRTVNCGGFVVHLQYNPHRMLSSSARVDDASIKARRCFLCSDNLPYEQCRLNLPGRFQLLVNPYPIFNEHFTIASLDHQPQRIAPFFSAMLTSAELMPKSILFYNGPRCGASAPDHLHFQAGNTDFLPIESDFNSKRWCNLVTDLNVVKVWEWHDYLRSFITFEGSYPEALQAAFESFYLAMDQSANSEEPMLNVLCSCTSGRWLVHLFPRKQHRPSQYTAPGDDQLLLSPASVDMGGVLVLPREVDYLKLTLPLIKDVFNQVSLSADETRNIIERGVVNYKG